MLASLLWLPAIQSHGYPTGEAGSARPGVPGAVSSSSCPLQAQSPEAEGVLSQHQCREVQRPWGWREPWCAGLRVWGG